MRSLVVRGVLVMFALATALSAEVRSPEGDEGERRVVRAQPPPGVMERVRAVEQLIESRNDESITRFVAAQLAPALQATRTSDEWLSYLRGIRQAYQGFGTIQLRPDGEKSLAIEFGDCPGEGTPLLVDIDPAPPHLITSLRQGEAVAAVGSRPRELGPPISWDNLRDRLRAEEASGFSGSVLIVRDGQIVLHEGYGMADRAEKRANKPETIFAIGSTPIDFTKAAILKLEDMGKLSTSDPITKFLPDVPKDKVAITIDHLMTGRSGLRNFLERPGDTDPDNMWIDRKTAIARILEDELLFAPGTDHVHSHAAFGLLAAIVEIVSGQTYGEFLTAHLFDPAGMKWTSNYENIRAPAEQVAIGYGGEDYTSVNSPAQWGRTSWLVMGSGGMVSTTGDLYRWNKAMREGKLLSPAASRKYWSPPGSLLMGASQNGFVTGYTEGPESMFVLCSNVIGRDATEDLVRSLAHLVIATK